MEELEKLEQEELAEELLQIGDKEEEPPIKLPSVPPTQLPEGPGTQVILLSQGLERVGKIRGKIIFLLHPASKEPGREGCCYSCTGC